MAVTAQWCLSFTFRDAKGQTRKITLCYNAEGAANSNLQSYAIDSAQQVVPVLQALSNAHVQQELNLGGGAAQAGVTWGTAANYQSVATQARLYYLTSDPGGDPSPTATITIPAPVASLFLADGVTVDPTNTAIAAFNAVALTPPPLTNTWGLATKSGLQYTTFIGGILIGKKLSRKWTKYTYNPELTVRGI